MRAAWRLVIQTSVLALFLIGVSLITSYLLFPALSKGVGEYIAYPLHGLSLLGACWLSIVVVGRRLDKRRLADYGCHVDRPWLLNFGFGLVLGAVLMGGIFWVEYSAGWIEIRSTLHTSRQAPFVVSIAGMLFLLLVVGICEELLARGYYLTNLADGFGGRWIGPKTAVVIAWLLSSALFAIGHVANPNTTLLSTTMLLLGGVLLGLGYVLTGELAIPMGLHITWNFFQGVVFGFSVSGNQSKTSFIAVAQGGPDLWTGGRFGPEAGLIGLVAMLVGAGAIVAWVRWQRGTVAIHGLLNSD